MINLQKLWNFLQKPYRRWEIRRKIRNVDIQYAKRTEPVTDIQTLMRRLDALEYLLMNSTITRNTNVDGFPESPAPRQKVVRKTVGPRKKGRK